MNSPAAAAPFALEAVPPVMPEREKEIWMGAPKGGKTLRGSDEAFYADVGFTPADRMDGVDDFRLVDGPDFRDVGLRAFVKRPKDALKDILRGGLDVAIVGRDVLKEVNASLPDGAPKLREILDLDMASCVLTLAVRQGDQITSMNAFNNAAIGTKYEKTLNEWLKTNGVAPSEVMVREGGIESLMRQYPFMKAIADIVESGKSLDKNGLIPYGMDPALWADVCSGKVRFADLPASVLGKIPGVITMSRAVLVRTPETLSPAKEKAIRTLAERFYVGAKQSGGKPRLKIAMPPRRKIYTPAQGFPGHLAARGA